MSAPVPRISPRRRHDRHGRGARGPAFLPGLPARRTRRETFDELVAEIVEDLQSRWPSVASIEFAVEDVPPSDPAPWEDHSDVLARVFPADRRRGLSDRVVVYRLPVEQRCQREGEVVDLVRSLLADRISHVLAIPPDELGGTPL